MMRLPAQAREPVDAVGPQILVTCGGVEIAPGALYDIHDVDP